MKRIKFDFTAEEKRERAKEKVREKELKQINEKVDEENKADEAIVVTEPKTLVFSNEIEDPILLIKNERKRSTVVVEKPIIDIVQEGKQIIFSNKYSRKNNVHLRIPEELVERYELFRKVVYSCRQTNQQFLHFQKKYRHELMAIAKPFVKEQWQLLPLTSKMASYLYHLQKNNNSPNNSQKHIQNNSQLKQIFTPNVMDNFIDELVPVKRNRSKLIDVNTEEGLLRLRKEHLIELMVEFSGYKLTESDANEIIQRLYISRSKTIPIRPRIHKKLQMAIFEKINSSVST